MKKALLCTPLLALFFTACGSQNEEASKGKVIIGENDLTYYKADDQMSRSIGRISLGCTGTHIGDNLVITAGHCISSSSCTSSKYNIRWNYRSNNRSGDFTSRCVEIVATENNSQRDYAILRYDSAPEEFLPLNTRVRPRAGDNLTILSHPQGRTLSWSGWCKHEGRFSGQKFSYKCDTEGGSSGAAVLNENLEIVGVHNLGAEYRGLNAGTYVMDIPAL